MVALRSSLACPLVTASLGDTPDVWGLAHHLTGGPSCSTSPPLSQLRQRRSEKWRTYPPDVLLLPVAEMDFSLAEPIRDALHAAVDRSDTGYAVPTPDLGEALAMFADQRWGWQLDPDAVVAAPDLSVAAVELFRVLCRPGDAVVISPPVYPPFFSWVPEAGTRLVEVPLRHEDKGWRLDWPPWSAPFETGRPRISCAIRRTPLVACTTRTSCEN